MKISNDVPILALGTPLWHRVPIKPEASTAEFNPDHQVPVRVLAPERRTLRDVAKAAECFPRRKMFEFQ